MRLTPVCKILLLWLGWWVVLFGFQAAVQQRLDLRRPDYALQWTVNETARNAQNNKPYLLDPFMNGHVSWDSEFYLGIADQGYDSPQMRQIPGPGPGGQISISYAFFPLYAWLMRLLALPLAALGLGRVAAVTLAGLVIALLGTLAAMLSLYDQARDWLGEDGGLRAAFYLLIFPTGFFLGQVYSEGLFLGLAFGSLALSQRGRLPAAGLLAALAVWTRPTGIALVLPLGLAALSLLRSGAPLRRKLLGAGAALLPLASLAGWWFSPLRPRFQFIEDHYFSRSFLAVGRSLAVWGDAWQAMVSGKNGQMTVYYALEFAMIAIGLAACLALLRKMPAAALFSLAVFTISILSGVPQSMNRYLLGLPVIFIGLSRLGASKPFDQGWTLLSTMTMTVLAMLFTFDLWVG